MAKMILAWDDKLTIAAVTATASSADPVYPALNTMSAQPSEVWRTGAGVNSANITFDMGASRTITAVYVGAANLTTTATMRVRLSTSDATGAAGDAFDTTALTMGINTTARRIFKLVGPGTGRYLRFDFADTALTQLEIGKISAWGSSWQPTYNFELGARLLHKDFSIVRDNLGGQQRSRAGSIRPGVLFTLPAFSAADKDAKVLPLLRTAGLASPICVCLDPAATDIGAVTFCGLIEETPEVDLFMTKFSRTAFRLWQRI
jgi:XRCC1 domain-containing protein